MPRARAPVSACCRATQPADVQTRVNAYLAASGLTGPRTTNVTDLPVTTTARALHAQAGAPSTTPISSPCSVRSARRLAADFGTIPLRAASVMRTEAQAAP